jgi:hypothetical protein
MLRIALAAAMIAGTVSVAAAQNRANSGGYGWGSNSHSNSVSGHFNSNGSYTQPHQRSNPNNTDLDNYSTRGNVNPYTGAVGTRSPRW